MLSLSYRHSVTRNDYYILCVAENFYRIGFFFLGFGLRRIFRFGSRNLRSFGMLCGGLTEKDIHKLPVHRTAHNLREEKSRRADDTAYRDEEKIVYRKARNRACHARKRVEERNRYGHIRAADSYREEIAENSRKYRFERKENPDYRIMSESENFRRIRHNAESHYAREHKDCGSYGYKLMTGINDGFLIDYLMKLTRSNKTADKSYYADRKSKSSRNHREYPFTLRRRIDSNAEHRYRSDDSRSSAAQTVKKSDHLRHLNHLYFNRKPDADRAAYDEHNVKEPYVENLVLKKSKYNGKSHTDRAQTIAENGFLYLTHKEDSEKHAQRKHAAKRII